ncbi:bomanin Bicipital 1-like isoform X2 [Drosophila montana]|uniref:bomanin Bicipital 1-like isoform X2 n=1 Tax=Drosophila montana TaxID=40370 RepID=UPI00313A7BB8
MPIEFTFAMRLFLVCALFAALLALAAGNVVINGACRDCSPPDAETLVVGDKVYKGRPGQGTVYINGQDSDSNAVRPQTGGGGAPFVVPEGYSGRVPGGSFVHNADCAGCDITG